MLVFVEQSRGHVDAEIRNVVDIPKRPLGKQKTRSTGSRRCSSKCKLLGNLVDHSSGSGVSLPSAMAYEDAGGWVDARRSNLD